MNLPFVQHIHAIDVARVLVTEQPSGLVDQLLQYHSVCVQVTSILPNNGPKAIHKISFNILL